MNKVVEVNNNFGLNKDKLLGALMLKYANPIVSIPFVSLNDSVDDLCKKANIEKRDNDFYYNDNLITRDMKIGSVVSSLYKLAEEDLSSEKNDLFFANMVKNIIKNEVLGMLEDKKTTTLTEADLIKSLYGIEEEVGGKSLC